MMRSRALSTLFALCTFAAAASSCGSGGITCRAGTSRCGDACADYASDPSHCGGCGLACATSQVCQAGACKCRPGTALCDGRCTVTATDPEHCGACGHSCASGEVCEAGACKATCELGVSTKCGGACVDPTKDPLHCGGCDRRCPEAQPCRRGECTWDLVAACFSTGQVVGISAEGQHRGSLKPLGTSPAYLARVDSVILAVDGLDRRLLQATFPALDELTRAEVLGAAPNHLLVDGDYVYVVNSEGGTLQVLRKTAPADETGLPLETLTELYLGENTYPQATALSEGGLWVPLFGGVGVDPSNAGQKVLRVELASRPEPRVSAVVDLTSLDLRAFDGGAPAARPGPIVSHRGSLYVALGNLDPVSYEPAGPGILAKIDPSSRSVSAVVLDAATCLNPRALVGSGEFLVVSCGGRPVYGPNWETIANERAGVVVLDANDRAVSSWSASCPTGAASADGGSGCEPVLPGALAVLDRLIYVADQSRGRLFVLELDEGGHLVERQGFASGSSPPVQICPLSPTGFANVAHLLALP